MSETIAVVVNGKTYTYPDMSDKLAEHVSAGRPVPSAWEFMRSAEAELHRNASFSAIRSWVHLDDEPVAYWVEIRPRKGHRVSGYRILGAAPHGAIEFMKPGCVQAPLTAAELDDIEHGV